MVRHAPLHSDVGIGSSVISVPSCYYRQIREHTSSFDLSTWTPACCERKLSSHACSMVELNINIMRGTQMNVLSLQRYKDLSAYLGVVLENPFMEFFVIPTVIRFVFRTVNWVKSCSLGIIPNNSTSKFLLGDVPLYDFAGDNLLSFCSSTTN